MLEVTAVRRATCSRERSISERTCRASGDPTLATSTRRWPLTIWRRSCAHAQRPSDRVLVFGFSPWALRRLASDASASRFFWSRPGDHRVRDGIVQVTACRDCSTSLDRRPPQLVALQARDWDPDGPNSLDFFLRRAAALRRGSTRGYVASGYAPQLSAVDGAGPRVSDARDLSRRHFWLRILLPDPRCRGAAACRVPRRPIRRGRRRSGITWHDEGPWVHNARNKALFGHVVARPVEPRCIWRRSSQGSSTRRLRPSASALWQARLVSGGHGARLGGRCSALELRRRRRAAERASWRGALLATNYVYVMWNRAALMEATR